MNLFQTLLAWLKRNRARRLEITFQLSQIALAVVAIFGYFYTVRPIYQKERLAEQVAEYEGVIKTQTPKIAENERRIAELQREREKLMQDSFRERERLTQEAQRDRTRLTNDLKILERQLTAAQEEKSKIESQTRFMVYRYRLPDGSPAVTNDQVRVAQIGELRQSFLSSLSPCAIGLSHGAFLSYGFAKEEETGKSWPFTEEELNAWRTYGAKYPTKRAIECIDSVTAEYQKRYAQTTFLPEIDKLRTEALDYANRADKPWTPPVQPEDMLKELAATRSSIEAEKTAELKKVEEAYGAWESIVLPDRREIYKNNYRVGKYNAEVNALGKTMSLKGKMQNQANQLRQSIQDEVRRLLTGTERGGQK